jgi:hypothetical protein
MCASLATPSRGGVLKIACDVLGEALFTSGELLNMIGTLVQKFQRSYDVASF